MEKLVTSNGRMIRALTEKLGLEVGIYKTQQDDLDSGIQVVKEAMEKHDIVITTGGVLLEILTIYLRFIRL